MFQCRYAWAIMVHDHAMVIIHFYSSHYNIEHRTCMGTTYICDICLPVVTSCNLPSTRSCLLPQIELNYWDLPDGQLWSLWCWQLYDSRLELSMVFYRVHKQTNQISLHWKAPGHFTRNKNLKPDSSVTWLVMQNELAILEFIHCLVETLDRFFMNVCELDLMFNIETVSPYLNTTLMIVSRK